MDSAIFDADMFGRAMGSSENSYQLTEGRFGGIASVLDADHAFVEDVHCNHNAYGYLSPSFSYQVGEWCFVLFCSLLSSVRSCPENESTPPPPPPPPCTIPLVSSTLPNLALARPVVLSLRLERSR